MKLMLPNDANDGWIDGWMDVWMYGWMNGSDAATTVVMNYEMLCGSISSAVGVRVLPLTLLLGQ